MGEVIHRAATECLVPKDSERSRSLQPPSPKVSRALAVRPDSGPFNPPVGKRRSVSPRGLFPHSWLWQAIYPHPSLSTLRQCPTWRLLPYSPRLEKVCFRGAATAIAQDAPSDNSSLSGGPGPKESPSPSPPPAVLLGTFPVASRAELQPQQITHACTDRGQGEEGREVQERA